MKIMSKMAVYSLVAISVVSCAKKQQEFVDPLLTNRDTTIIPSEDFFHYANGGWFKKHPIPSSEKSNGIFRMIQDTINNQIKNICIKSAEAEAPKGSLKQKIGDFYASGMDSIAIDKAGISPLKNEIAKIDAVNDFAGLLQAIGHLHTIEASPAFGFYVGQDDKISSKNALFLTQGGLGLGQRDYYFENDENTKKIREAYPKHMAKMFELTGMPQQKALSSATLIMKMETELASHSRKLEALRDPIQNYHKMSLAALNALTPSIDWKVMFSNLNIKQADSVIVGQPEFFKALDGTLKKYSIEDWKTYLKWDLYNTYASYLDKKIEEQNFYFFSTVMNGIKEQKPRWKRIVEETDSALGELIGQVYVKEYLPEGTKEKLLEIGNTIRDVYAVRIKKLDWMSEATKVMALNKLSKIVMKVGYPDKWKDMSSVTIDKTSYCKNVMAVHIWEYQYMIAKYGKPVDRTEWGMYPQTYNAYYNPSNNEICVPACNIIVPGFEGRMPDDAILYGIIGGSTFGHEITHGFDDQGSQYDDKGNLNNWWTKEDYAKFKAKTALIVKQFNQYKIGDKNINGEATQGENIADLGGVVMGYEAFKKTKQFKTKEIIGGLTPEKRYFLAYGYAWMVQATKESLLQQVMSDVHSPAQFRINGPLANIPEFYKAFSIKPGSPMYQPDSLRVSIW
ncbi:M13 family metallopeptidase [Flavobacterium aciduliphilum]|uniref:Putative endopeptidase n=1 Tax=Flavobacterium aciduliphilum TaxID=1101402 RepID=A0A328YH18_9FLAO|nr:M13 family metallopeptidase [Flavobacterium aciduliphilum]RAR69259.1 putative endopeptidase [Flavobacterium aciduliphilum]